MPRRCKGQIQAMSPRAPPCQERSRRGPSQAMPRQCRRPATSAQRRAMSRQRRLRTPSFRTVAAALRHRRPLTFRMRARVMLLCGSAGACLGAASGGRSPPPPIFSRRAGAEPLHIGWGGAVCGGHLNHDDGPAVKCKKALMFGTGMPPNEARVRIRQWLLEGLLIDDADPLARTTHVRMKPRTFALMDEARVNRLAP